MKNDSTSQKNFRIKNTTIIENEKFGNTMNNYFAEML